MLVYDRTGSPFLSSLTFALGFLPFLLGGGLLSAIVDRVRPRALVDACNAGSAVIALLMAWPGMPVPALLTLLFCLGTLASLAGGARNVLVRATVSDDAYVPARSLMRIASQSAQIGGNAVGGALVVAVGTSGAILLNALTFAASFALIRLFVSDYAIAGAARASNLLRDSLEGFGDVFRRVELSRLVLLGWLVPMFSVAPEALAAPYVSGRGGSATLVGIWLCALPLGTIAGDIAGVRFLSPARQRRLVFPVAAAGFVPYLFFRAHPPVAVGLVLLVLSGLCGMYSLGLDGRIRDAAPAELFPRVMTVSQAGLMTLQGLGFALAGAVAEIAGAGATIALAGCAGLLVTLSLALIRGRAGTSGRVLNLST